MKKSISIYKLHRNVIIFILISLIILVTIALYYKELYQEDSYTHYLMAKYARTHNWLFLDIWGRPIPTTILSFAAPLGLFPTKILTIMISLLCAIITYYLARAKNLRYSEYIVPFLIFQPYYLLISVNPLTEIIFATLLTISLLYLINKNYVISTIICSVLPLARPEGFFFLILWMFILINKKKWKSIPFLGLGCLTWNCLGFLQTGEIIWLYNNFPWLGQKGVYGSGSFFHFLFLVPEITGILLLFFIIGLIHLIAEKRLLFPIVFFYFLLLHTILWTFGLFKSGGYARYFVSIAPIIAIITIYGLNILYKFLKIPKISLPAFTALFITSSIFSMFSIQKPSLNTDHYLIKNAYHYYAKSLSTEHPLICASNYFFYLSNKDRFNYEHFPLPDLQNLQKSIHNTIVIWDSKFFAKECGISKEQILDLGYQKVKFFVSENPFYEVAIFTKP